MNVIAEAMKTAFHSDLILLQGDEIIPIVQGDLNQSWSGQHSVR